MSKFKNKLIFEQKVTNVALERYLVESIKEAGSVDVELVKMLEAVKKFVLRGGKRARSILVRSAYGLSGGTGGDEVLASLFAELMHLYILIHDDIADRDVVRYGGDTLQVMFEDQFKEIFDRENKHFGMSVAMVSGDLVQTLAHDVLLCSGFDAKRMVECERLMVTTLKKVVTGWYLHQLQNHQSIESVSEERYLDGMRLVSSSYSFEMPLMLGVILGKGSEELRVNLKEYAYYTGMAFQIQDDILGVFGESEVTGKPVGNDIREGKKTLLVLKLFERAGNKERRMLKEKLGSNVSDKDIRVIQKLIRESGSLGYSKKLALESVDKAKAAINKVGDKSGDEVEFLANLAEFSVARDH